MNFLESWKDSQITDLIKIYPMGAEVIKKNTEASLLASKETGLEVNADKTEYLVMSRDQNVGRVIV